MMIQHDPAATGAVAMHCNGVGGLQPPGVLQQQRSVRNQPALESFPIIHKNTLHMNPP